MSRNSNDRRIGYFCSYTPKELIKAAGYTPIRILTKSKEIISLANGYIQSYCCSQIKGSLESALKSEMKMEGVIFTRTCDSMMRLTDIWEKATSMSVYNLEFPTNINENAKEYFKNELYDFKKVLERWSGNEITTEKLKESIRSYLILENILKEIFEIKPDYKLLIEAQMDNVETMINKSRQRLAKIKNEKSNSLEKNKIKALITGSVCPDLKIFDLIRNTGFSIIDDLCTGSRFFGTDKDLNIQMVDKLKTIEECFNLIIEKYFKKFPCPTKHFTNDKRFDYLIQKSEEVSVVIFLLLKYCEPHFFDYPQIRKRLKENGKMSHLIELDFPISTYEELKTRLEAIYEMVSSNE